MSGRLLVSAAASLCAVALAASPAPAQSRAGQWSRGSEAVSIWRNMPPPPGAFGGEWRGRHPDRERRRDQRRGDALFVYDYGVSRDWDGNRSWDADRWNDWWHERPWRSYPRWVQGNSECPPERRWWGGGVWRCSW